MTLSSTAPTNEEKRNNMNIDLNLSETELRLGLPGPDSPHRNPPNGLSSSHLPNNLDKNANACSSKSLVVAGSKRCFLDVIKRSDQKLASAESEVDMGKSVEEKRKNQAASAANEHASSLIVSKAQVVGWPPIQAFRKNAISSIKTSDDDDGKQKEPVCLYVKVSMDGAPYLRKIDLNTYKDYAQLSSAVEKMFSCFIIGQSSLGLRSSVREGDSMALVRGSEYVLTYEDKDGDWMLVGDVPWKMFADSCRRLRVTKGSEATGLALRVGKKCRNQN